MYAHFWALCCLVTVTSFPALAEEARIEVLLQNADNTPHLLLGEMKFELNALMERAGFDIQWRSTQDSATAVNGDLVVVELRGSCEPPSTSISEPLIVQLGSSAVADGKVLPFSWVDCTALAQLLEPYLTRKQKELREFVYGRAIARVIAHEFYHVLGHTLAHTKSGLTKSRFEPSDLLDERAEFGNVAVAHLQTLSLRR
jgi:hypothetical protein